MGSLLLDKALLKKASAFLNVLDNDTRWDIIEILHLKGSMTVTELYIYLRMEQSQASQHLRLLRYAGFVTTSRNGKFIHYSLNYEHLKKAGATIDGFLKKTAPNYLQDYRAYIETLIPFFKPVPFSDSYEGMQAWLASFTQKLKAYHIALGEKKRELLLEAKKENKVDLQTLRATLEKSSHEGIKAFIQQNKP